MQKPVDVRRMRLFDIVETGNDGDFVSRGYDILSTLIIFVNLAISIALTYDKAEASYGGTLRILEGVTYLFFGIDYALRVFTARCRCPQKSEAEALKKYVFSFMGIVDLLSFLPYYLPVFFPAGAVTFRLFRVIRIFRLFRISVYYDSLNVITEVIRSKKQQLLSSFFIILVLMVASSLCMYSLEHEAQPEVFENAFSGIWWSVSTLLTVGYGDIYPITPLGRIFGIVISFLGVGMVAIPTGIISAGFVDQYSRAKRISEYGEESDVHFIKATVTKIDGWCGREIRDIAFPDGLLVAAVRRGRDVVVPRGDTVLEAGDLVVLGAESFRDDEQIALKEIVLRDYNPWIGEYIRDLDISRKTIVVMIRRNGRMIVARGDLMLEKDDCVFLYTHRRLRDARTYDI